MFSFEILNIIIVCLWLCVSPNTVCAAGGWRLVIWLWPCAVWCSIMFWLGTLAKISRCAFFVSWMGVSAKYRGVAAFSKSTWKIVNMEYKNYFIIAIIKILHFEIVTLSSLRNWLYFIGARQLIFWLDLRCSLALQLTLSHLTSHGRGLYHLRTAFMHLGTGTVAVVSSYLWVYIQT